jgi:hypothetical protein
LEDAHVSEISKAKFMEFAAVCEKQLKEGSSPDICLLNFLT